MTTVDLPSPKPRDAQAIEHTHRWGGCLHQYCPKLGVWDYFRRCLDCGQCKFC